MDIKPLENKPVQCIRFKFPDSEEEVELKGHEVFQWAEPLKNALGDTGYADSESIETVPLNVTSYKIGKLFMEILPQLRKDPGEYFDEELTYLDKIVELSDEDFEAFVKFADFLACGMMYGAISAAHSIALKKKVINEDVFEKRLEKAGVFEKRGDIGKDPMDSILMPNISCLAKK